MLRRALFLVALFAFFRSGLAWTQPQSAGSTGDAAAKAGAPLPDARSLLLDVERNEKRMEALRNDYTYHVHMVQEELRKDGGIKKTEVTDSESLTINGIRVNRVVARNGKPLTPEEQARENERLDKEAAKGRDRRSKATEKGEETDDRGNPILSVTRVLELGAFSNERRENFNGRAVLLLDYAGDPQAKTRSAVENVMRDLVGTVWIDEADHVLVRGQGHFLNDFKIGGGLVADIHKGTHFAFEATRVNEGVWLPAHIDGEGSLRLLLLAGFAGRFDLVTSDYRRFRTSATILPGRSVVDAEGKPVPATPPESGTAPVQKPQR